MLASSGLPLQKAYWTVVFYVILSAAVYRQHMGVNRTKFYNVC